MILSVSVRVTKWARQPIKYFIRSQSYIIKGSELLVPPVDLHLIDISIVIVIFGKGVRVLWSHCCGRWEVQLLLLDCYITLYNITRRRPLFFQVTSFDAYGMRRWLVLSFWLLVDEWAQAGLPYVRPDVFSWGVAAADVRREITSELLMLASSWTHVAKCTSEMVAWLEISGHRLRTA